MTIESAPYPDRPTAARPGGDAMSNDYAAQIRLNEAEQAVKEARSNHWREIEAALPSEEPP